MLFLLLRSFPLSLTLLSSTVCNMKTSINQDYTIGRSDSNHFVVAHNVISRQHATIRQVSPSVFVLTDLDTTYGTFVNGWRIRKKVVTAEDEIYLGGTKGQGIPWIPPNAFGDVKRPAQQKQKKNPKRGQLKKPAMVIEREFLQLEERYRQYKETCRVIRKEERRSKARWRAAIGMIPFVGMPLSILLSGESSIEDKLVAVEEEFRRIYCCPNCSETLGMVDWTVLRARNMCMACRVSWLER